MLDRKPPIVWLTVLGVGTLSGLFVFGIPSLSAQRPQPVDADDAPLGDDDVDAIDGELRADRLVGAVVQRTRSARDRAADAARCEGLDRGVSPARKLFYGGAYKRAEGRLRRLLDEAPDPGCPDVDASEVFAKARHLLGHAYLESDRPKQAVETLESIDTDGPISDYTTWLRARALEADGRPSEAADAYGTVYESVASPVRFRARARQALTLAEADRWDDALPVIDQMLETFPDYPRRFKLLHYRGVALEHQGQLADAAEAYQTAWYEYPHKNEGDLALAALERLRDQGVDVEPLDRGALYSRYRRLRRYRHWDLADTLFNQLLEREATPDGHSKFEHRVLFQLALTAYAPKRNETALRYLQQLRRSWERGHRAGINIRTVDKYLSRTYARLGRFDEALAALKRTLKNSGAAHRKSELAEFYAEHGRYEQAFQLVDSYYSNWRKRRWRYAWLLYQTGRFEAALGRFDDQIDRHSGQTKARAKYWRARTLERQGHPKEAREAYAEIARNYALSYYGIQARNRLLDNRQRNSVDGNFDRQLKTVIGDSGAVLQEMDAAARALEDQPRRPDHDRTAIPRTGNVDNLETLQEASRECMTGSPRDPAFCQLLAGEIPDETMNMLDGLLAPGRAPTGYFFGGLHALQVGKVHVDKKDAAGRVDPQLEAALQRRPASNRVDWNTQARIYWNGRFDSEVAFAKFEKGRAIGPIPEPVRAYADRTHVAGLERAASRAGDLFPELVRADWLYDIGLHKEARRAIRDVGLEYRALRAKGRPADGDPHELDHKRWTYLVDYRRGRRGYWGYQGDDVPRFPVPDDEDGKRELAERQQTIVERADDLRPTLMDAMKEVGDYHLVRDFTYDEGRWYHRSPTGPARDQWIDAYPRAFPHLVVQEASEHGINPYLIWALMTVESTYNPDSISTAEAIGLLQVIPRTGNKVASWIGAEDFGPYDLVDEEVAVAHGTRYFSSLVDKFRGQELFAIAGYNGGPHRVATWLKKRGRVPMDEFVEEIPFNQARAYVKKVLRVMHIYLRLYEGRDSLYVGQNVDLDYRPYPNF